MSAIGAIAITLLAISCGQSVWYSETNCADADWQRVVVGGRVEDDQRPEEVVPRALELEDRDRRDRRPGERQHHLPERLEVAGAVELRRLLEVRGIVRKYWRIRKRLRRGDELDQDVARDSGRCRCQFVSITKTGTSRSWSGIISVTSTSDEQHLAPGEAQARERVAAERAEEDVQARDGRRQARRCSPRSGRSRTASAPPGMRAGVGCFGSRLKYAVSGSVFSEVEIDPEERHEVEERRSRTAAGRRRSCATARTRCARGSRPGRFRRERGSASVPAARAASPPTGRRPSGSGRPRRPSVASVLPNVRRWRSVSPKMISDQRRCRPRRRSRSGRRRRRRGTGRAPGTSVE